MSDSSTRLDKTGKFFTGALTAVTAVLTIFGFSEGIPERMLRNQPVAASISFGLIGLAILLAALSTFSFDENHPSYIGLRQNGKPRLLQPSFRSAWRFFLLSFTFFALTTFIVLWLGGLLEEAGFSFIQQLAVALAAGLAALPITFVWTVPAANDPTPPADNPTPPADNKTIAQMRTRRLLLSSLICFALGLLLIAEIAVTSPGLTIRPQLAAGVEGNVLTTTVRGEGVGANRTYAFMVQVVPDRGPPSVLQRLQTGADGNGKIDSTIKTALPAGTGGRILIVTVPTELIAPEATEPADSKASESKSNLWENVKAFVAEFKDPKGLIRKLADDPPVSLQELKDCPSGYSAIACMNVMRRVPPPTAQLINIALTNGESTKPRQLKFKVSGHDLSVTESVYVQVLVKKGKKIIPLQEVVLPGTANGVLDPQELNFSVPPGCRSLCIRAQVKAGHAKLPKEVTCRPTKQVPGVAAAWVQL